jgi:hypothetical protein
MAKKSSTGGSHYRDAGSGEFVTKKYAEKHPKTTIKESPPKPAKKK